MSIDPYGLGVWIEMEEKDITIWDLVDDHYITSYVWDREETELMELT